MALDLHYAKSYVPLQAFVHQKANAPAVLGNKGNARIKDLPGGAQFQTFAVYPGLAACGKKGP